MTTFASTVGNYDYLLKQREEYNIKSLELKKKIAEIKKKILLARGSIKESTDNRIYSLQREAEVYRKQLELLKSKMDAINIKIRQIKKGTI